MDVIIYLYYKYITYFLDDNISDNLLNHTKLECKLMH
jgi:hypothetical protein